MKQLLRVIPSVLIVAFCLFSFHSFGQSPYIETGDGLGKYGYLETDATTYAKLNTNGGNWKELAARWYISDEWIYYPGIKGNCDAAGQQTADYASSNHASWAAGNVAYVSVKGRGCDDNWYPGGVNGTGYNERDFQLIDVSNTGYSGALATNVVKAPTGTQNLVGTFSIDAGGASLTLNRLWLFNTGTAKEGSDIPNDGVKLYYEAITGTEEYDGTESSKTLYGDYGGNSTSNEEFGSDALGISIPSSGLRVYVVVDKLANSYTVGHTALFQIINDGISFSETRNGFNLMRMNTLPTAAQPATLPVQFTTIRAKSVTSEIDVTWQTATETNNAHFNIERSTDSRNWLTLGKVAGAGTTQEVQNYTFADKAPAVGTNYYRIQQVDYDGAFSYSPIVSAQWKGGTAAHLFPNPAATTVRVDLLDWEATPVTLSLYDMLGRLVLQRTQQGTTDLDISQLPTGAYLLKATQGDALLLSERLMVE